MSSSIQIDVWSAEAPPREIRPARGFAAIVGPERLVDTTRAVLDLGGWVVAATIAGELVGYASLLRPRPIAWQGRRIARRWDDLDGVVELGALEIARPYRHAGLGRRIAAALGADPRLDAVVLFGVAVVHHWDLAWSSLPPFVHRLALAATLQHAGMSIVPTDDPEVRLHAANALFVRVGRRAPASTRAAFEAKLVLGAGEPVAERTAGAA